MHHSLYLFPTQQRNQPKYVPTTFKANTLFRIAKSFVSWNWNMELHVSRRVVTAVTNIFMNKVSDLIIVINNNNTKQ